MFTGIVEEAGRVLWLRRTEKNTQLVVKAAVVTDGLRVGDSLAVNGCCLTLTEKRGDQLRFDLLDETLAKTNLGALRPDSLVNLERPLRADGRMGGHFVQGHVDCRGEVVSLTPQRGDYRLEVRLAPEDTRFLVYKGSIAINGVSLTVAEVHPSSLVVWLIPHTMSATNLSGLAPGAPVNLEFDILAKYVERMLQARGA